MPLVGAGVYVTTFWQEASYNHHHELLLYRKIWRTFWRKARHSHDARLLLVREIVERGIIIVGAGAYIGY